MKNLFLLRMYLKFALQWSTPIYQDFMSKQTLVQYNSIWNGSQKSGFSFTKELTMMKRKITVMNNIVSVASCPLAPTSAVKGAYVIWNWCMMPARNQLHCFLFILNLLPSENEIVYCI